MIAIEAALHGAELTIAVLPDAVKTAQLVMAEILSKCGNAAVKICLVNEIEGKFDLLVNATPVGMYPKVDACPVSDEVIENCLSFFDVIYNPIETLLIKKARALGRTAVGGAAMLVYQANMANSMKQMLELMKGEAAEQTAGVERIVNRFVEQMNGSLGVNFQKLGNQLKNTADLQMIYTNNSKDLIEAATALVEVNRNMQEVLTQVIARQETFARELQAQGDKLNATCDEISEEVSNQLYAFDQMRNLYEK